MKLNRKELKEHAKVSMKGNMGSFWLTFLLVTLLASLISTIPVIGTIPGTTLSSIIGVAIGRNIWDMGCCETRDPLDLFSRNFFGWIILVFRIAFQVMLWSMLFFIPGIIKAVAYSQALYIYADNPDMKSGEAIKASRQLMKGRFWEYIIYGLSFYPWLLLCACTCGIAAFYVTPYMCICNAGYYRFLSDNIE